MVLSAHPVSPYTDDCTFCRLSSSSKVKSAAAFVQGQSPTHACRCTRTVPKPIELEVLGLALSEKQIPQIVENNQSGNERMEPLEATGVRPRQVRYQAVLMPRLEARVDIA
jgi:hypothetical protein